MSKVPQRATILAQIDLLHPSQSGSRRPITGAARACKTVPVPAAPEDSRLVSFDDEPPLGTFRTGDAELGPISPELALVDPVLAENARQLLPDPRERLKPRPRPAAPTSAPLPATGQAEKSAPRAASRQRRWRRTVLLAGLVLAFGAVFSGFLAEWPASPGPTLEVRSGAPTARHSEEAKPSVQKPALSAGRTPVRTPKAKDKRRPRSSTTAQQDGRPVSRVTWAANVLGVAAQVDRPGVTLVWHRPADSGHVVVLRSLAARTRGDVVYRGRASSYRDASPRPCTAYRYTIVNYDRNGRRSTGVPTSVVTGGCT